MRSYGLLAAVFIQFLITVSIADELSHVYVTDNSQRTDIVGQAMKLVPSEKGPNCLWLIIMTIDLEAPNGDHVSTYYHVTWVNSLRDLGNHYLDEVMGSCGAKRIPDTAETIVARTDKILSSMTPPSR